MQWYIYSESHVFQIPILWGVLQLQVAEHTLAYSAALQVHIGSPHIVCPKSSHVEVQQPRHWWIMCFGSRVWVWQQHSRMLSTFVVLWSLGDACGHTGHSVAIPQCFWELAWMLCRNVKGRYCTQCVCISVRLHTSICDKSSASIHLCGAVMYHINPCIVDMVYMNLDDTIRHSIWPVELYLYNLSFSIYLSRPVNLHPRWWILQVRNLFSRYLQEEVGGVKSQDADGKT